MRCRRPGLPVATAVWLGGILLLSGIVVRAEPVVIKFATLAPEGTPWMNLMQEMNQEVQRQTHGEVSFRFYPGGVAGDERDVIRKIRINQLHGGAFSGFGLGDILPEIRALELPMLFRDQAEAEHVVAALRHHLAATFTQKGFVLLSLDEAGPVYIFSQRPIRSRDDLSRARMWTWQGDPLPLAMFQAYGVTPVPLALPDVLPSLQSGLIDACYGPPLAILALQWFTRVKYRVTVPITHVLGALVVSTRQWQRLSPTQQTQVRQIIETYNAKATRSLQEHHQKALTLLASLGIESLELPEAEVTRLRDVSLQVREALVGKLYSRDLLDRVLAIRNHYRQTGSTSR